MPSTARMIISALFLLGFVLLVEWGAWRSMHRMWSQHHRFELLRKVWWAVSVVQFLWFLLYLYRWPVWREHHPQYLLLTHAVLISLLVPKLWLGGTELIEAIRQGIQWLLTRPEGRSGIPRRTFITWSGQAVAGILLTSFAYGMTRGRYGYHVRRIDVPIPDLPDGMEGLRIVQISDAHLGSFLEDFGPVEQGLALIQSLDPDLLCFTGDLVNDHSDEAEPWVSRFKALEARYGKFSILGNHDYADYARRTDEERNAIRQRIREIHGEMGFDLLLDQHRYIERGGDRLLLAGIQNWGKGFRQTGDLDAALEGADTSLPTVLLSHDPTHWEERVMGAKAPVELTLSGHTHGMQMGLELPALGIKISPSRLRYRRWGGLYTEGQQHLHVNRGFGLLGFPGRIGMPPEITELTLRKA
ncbi:MAG: metallophosphoesterase [Flavobacteriales bacterium]|nr:metallophosphoesterase [Flavobacteriales bacterium]